MQLNNELETKFYSKNTLLKMTDFGHLHFIELVNWRGHDFGHDLIY